MSAYYRNLFAQAKAEELSDADAADRAAIAFLDGRPARRGKHRVAAGERHAAFWSATFLIELPPEAWRQESLVLALARYLGQDAYACPAIVDRLATVSPDVLQRAARYAGLVLRPESPRSQEIEALATSHPQAFGEFVRMLVVFRRARIERVNEVERLRQPLAVLTPLALLAYASLFAFEHLVPMHLQETDAEQDADLQSSWGAIEAILAWKLETCDMADLRLDERTIGLTLREHLSPFLLPSPQTPPTRDLYAAFSVLVDAQIELDAFDSRSANAFSYDDSVRFVLRGGTLDIDIVDDSDKAARAAENRKLSRLHQYWLYRGMEALLASPELLARVSHTNLDANLQAFAKASGTWLQLQEVYGVDAFIDMESGLRLDVFDALKAIELMTAFYIEDFMLPYAKSLRQWDHPWLALGQLAFGGLLRGENRFPLSWSERSAKIARIQPWTATHEWPQGHPRATEAILEFWTSDWEALANQLRGGEPGLKPRLQERPILKLGQYLFQLPWLLAMQNNAMAAINNLRRLGANRKGAREETRRIEQRLGERFVDRGFRVLVGHRLSAQSADDADREEIDLLCAADGRLLVLELKSTFMRRSRKEAWFHRTTTLRKAGLQLRRKMAAVRCALVADDALRSALELDADSGTPEVTGWIVDTSIECDHERFGGFLKVSLEEVLITLRDERRWLNDPDGLFGPSAGKGVAGNQDGASPVADSLYPDGFSASRFIAAVEAGAVWAAPT